MLSYNEFWYERGIELTSDKRTSLIVDPPNGRRPPRTEEAIARGRGGRHIGASTCTTPTRNTDRRESTARYVAVIASNTVLASALP